ncbi:glycerate kinase [Pseudahrensia aquimaris]|uniref:Glycerate kinase n=1 Tax=Pseudahrensia aquimaris TaxID=744461 RepID=A0ABW3FGR7_9HYPH
MTKPLNPPSNETEATAFLRDLFGHAVTSAMPQTCLPNFLPQPPKGRTLAVAIGKAAASMARSVEQHWPDNAPLTGIALTRYGHGEKCERIEVIEAAHPVPDDRGFEATKQIMTNAGSLTEKDMLLVLVSGGGSALMTAPAQGIKLSEKQAINKALLMSGAPIGEMNVVRKHLSSVKGGRLAQVAAPAQVVTLAISDVPHDDPSTIASGPTVPDASTCDDALALIEQYGIEVSPAVRDHLESPQAETPKPGDPIFERTKFHMISRPKDMIETIARRCSHAGISVENLGADIEGEAHDVARIHADLARLSTAQLILSGGETTVTVANNEKPGRGGRNCEYLLALAVALNGESGVCAIAADTDGIDGSETNAGAVITPDTLMRAKALGLNAQDHLDRHDSFTFFERLGDLVTTGPTRTNVNDFRAIWTGRKPNDTVRGG